MKMANWAMRGFPALCGLALVLVSGCGPLGASHEQYSRAAPAAQTAAPVTRDHGENGGHGD
ncbi:MAG: hypothetical protein GC186_02245 [Rhodobacteraceae bacterium]|nr:hypothetical protein [Paracoccaceae bacterium]